MKVGENQGLAAAAIVLSYGFMGALFGLLAAILSIMYTSTNTIKKLIYTQLVFIILMFSYNYIQRSQERKSEEKLDQLEPKKERSNKVAWGSVTQVKQDCPNENYMGMAHIQLPPGGKLFLFGSQESASSYAEPVDSIIFNTSEYGQLDISYAPPALFPEHLKLDYNIFLMRLKSIARHAIEVELNKSTCQTHWIAREDTNVELWPEFIINTHSVELLRPDKQSFRIKPLDHASLISQAGEIAAKAENYILVPERIKGDWLYVLIKDQYYEDVTTAWIKWREDGKLMLSYNLLS